MTEVLSPRHTVVSLILLFTVVSGIRVYEKAGVVLQENGNLLAYKDVESLAFKVVIKKPDLTVPEYFTHNSSSAENDRNRSSLYQKSMKSLKDEMLESEEGLRFWIKPESESGYVWRNSRYNTFRDRAKKLTAKRNAEEELTHKELIWENRDNTEEETIFGQDDKIRVSEHLFETYEDMSRYFKFTESSFSHVFFFSFRSDQSRNVDKYRRRLDDTIKAMRGVEGLSGIIKPNHVEKIVKEYDIFQDTLYRQYPMSLYQFSEMEVLNFTATDEYLSLVGILTFPVLREENVLQQFYVAQVGYVTRENGTRCVKHLLPKKVTLYKDSYYEIKCGNDANYLTLGGSRSGLCRLDYNRIDSQLSCFNGKSVECLKLPVQCDEQAILNLKEGVLVASAQEIKRYTEAGFVVKITRNGSVFIPWEGTDLVSAGDGGYANPANMEKMTGGYKHYEEADPDADYSLTHTESYLFDIDIPYTQTDLALLESSLNLTSSMVENEVILRYIAAKRAEVGEMVDELEKLSERVLKEKRKVDWDRMMSLGLSVLNCVVMAMLVIVYHCNKHRFSFRHLVREVPDDKEVL